jgi:hypothetical protein
MRDFRPRRYALLALGFLSALALFGPRCSTAQQIAPWPPADPNQENTTVAFTKAWLLHLRGFRTLSDLQRAAGAGGKITEITGVPDPTVSIHWRSLPPGGLPAYMLATLRPNGAIGVGVLTTDGLDCALNTDGAFGCQKAY